MIGDGFVGDRLLLQVTRRRCSRLGLSILNLLEYKISISREDSDRDPSGSSGRTL